MPGTAVTKSVVANDPGGRRREEIFVDIIEKISVTFSSSVSSLCGSLYLPYHIKLFILADQCYVVALYVRFLPRNYLFIFFSLDL